ncbi:GNAT family N-acetyltransferase [Actinoplanes sp. NPDC051513]|uniref:GNAT family N-acetyltransferase n=1 Tax=Actinoplanes sp. NPDC051513 TaxID=3363908 RepID=UPI0037A9F177
MTNFWLEPWDKRGPALERRANTPEMQAFLGGVESEESIMSRHKRILDGVRDGTTGFYLIMVDDCEDPVGSVGYWEKEWLGQTVFEMGWKVLPGFQGRGLAVGATIAAIGLAAAEGRRRFAHAYPKVDNAASNAICRKAGFELLGECDFEYPKGHPIRCNDWRFDLKEVGGPP